MQAKHKCLPVVIVLNRSWPAVSHIWSLILLLSSSMVRILKSILQKIYYVNSRVFMWKCQELISWKETQSLPYGCDKTSCEGTIREPQEEATLTHTYKRNWLGETPLKWTKYSFHSKLTAVQPSKEFSGHTVYLQHLLASRTN